MQTTNNDHPLDSTPTPTSDSDSTPDQRRDASATLEMPGRRGRTGKIARLPLPIRRQLNRRLQNGEPGKTIVEWLRADLTVQAIIATEFDGRPINEGNLSQWRHGGYKDWEQAETLRESVFAFAEQVIGLDKATPEGLANCLAIYLAAQTALELKRMESVPFDAQEEKVRRELTSRVVALRRGDLELERLRLQRERYELRHKTKEERTAEFWKWAEEDINRDEFCRRRCYTAEEREAAIDKILGLTPEERHETVPTSCDSCSMKSGANAT